MSSPRLVEGPKFDESYDQDLGTFFFEAAEKYSDKIFHIDAETGVEETYESARARAIKSAIFLRKEGIKCNDVVTICSGNSMNNTIPCLGALYIGAQVTSIDPSLSLAEMQHCFQIVPPRIVYTEECCLEKVVQIVRNLKSKVKIVVMGESNSYETFKNIQNTTVDVVDFQPTKSDANATAFIIFSSGTTGLPKGICCTHRGLYYNSYNFCKTDYMKPDVMFHFTSLYFVSGINTLVAAHFNGSTRIICPRFTPTSFMEIIQKHKVTYTFLSPFLSYKMLTVCNPEQYDTSSLYSLTIAGDPCADNQINVMRNFFKHSKIQFNYGMTETSGLNTQFDLTLDKDIYMQKKGSVGKPLRNSVFKVVDIETRKLLPPNEHGEICIKSPGLFSGYYNQDSSDTIDNEGFLKTGDIGYYDDDDCIYVIDRIRDMLKYQLWHVIPLAVEEILMQHPKVDEAVVFGIPDKVDGEHPAAMVVLKQGAETTIEELHSFLKERASERQQLRGGIRIVETIPKSRGGKYPRRKIRDLFLALKNK